MIRRYGLFHYAFLERNLHDAFTRLPEIRFSPPQIGFNGEGMSLFVTTPLFLYLLWPKERPPPAPRALADRRTRRHPRFFYQNSGYYQFGFRVLARLHAVLDPAARPRRAAPFTRLFWLAAFAGFAVNGVGGPRSSIDSTEVATQQLRNLADASRIRISLGGRLRIVPRPG